MKKVPDHLSWRDLPHEVTLPKHSHDRLRQSEPVPPKRAFGYPSEVVEDLSLLGLSASLLMAVRPIHDRPFH